MLPFVLLLLGVGAYAVYELTPKVTQWVNDHAKAMTDALAAHHVADTALDAAYGVPPSVSPTTVVREKFEEMKQDATGQPSLPALAAPDIGTGDCSVHTYDNVTPQDVDKLIARLREQGMEVTGDNPWKIDTNERGVIVEVKLEAAWDPATETLKLIVTAGSGAGAVCDQIWAKIDPAINMQISGWEASRIGGYLCGQAPAASMPLTPTSAVRQRWEFIQAAKIANQVAAAKTADAAQAARTPAEREAVRKSAEVVIKRSAAIEAALVNLGTGDCGVHSYQNVTVEERDRLLAGLARQGMDVTGTNPWNIDTGRHGVMLRAIWDPQTNTLHLIVSDSDVFAPCNAIWSEIDPAVKAVVGRQLPWIWSF